MAADGFDFVKLQIELETKELESSNGVASPQIYSQLLALYLLHNDLCNAKFLWKRIPQNVKNGCPELLHIWTVGQKMWTRDFPSIYESLKKDWSETVKPIMTALIEMVRKRAFDLVAVAYSSINATDFAAFMGMPVKEAVAAVAETWEVDPHGKMLYPRKPAPESSPVYPSEHQLSVLTDYVAFLEN